MAEVLIDELSGMKPTDSHYAGKFKVLAEYVQHHIQEEEQEMFPKARSLGTDRLMQMGQQMEQSKQTIMAEMQKPRGASTGKPRSTSRKTGTRSRARSSSSRSRSGTRARSR